MKESDIQNAILDMLIKHPNVSHAHVMTTGKIKGRGGHWITLGYPGVSDIIGMTKKGRFFAIEVKVPGKTPSREQIDYIDLINSNGGMADWVTNVEDAKALIDAGAI